MECMINFERQKVKREEIRKGGRQEEEEEEEEEACVFMCDLCV